VTRRRLPGLLLVIVGAAGFTVCLRSAFAGLRDVMVTDRGSCASGGRNVSAHPCSAADMRLLLAGLLGGLLATGVLAAGTRLLGRSGMPTALLAWTALFAALGWNFVRLGLHPTAGQTAAAGWLISGAVLWLLAVRGFGPAVAVRRESSRAADLASTGLWLAAALTGPVAGVIVGTALVSLR